jgi:hypothetical protein
MSTKNESIELIRRGMFPFAGDLVIVGAENRLTPHSPLDIPEKSIPSEEEKHMYHLTALQEKLTEEKLAMIKVGFVGCIDWRTTETIYQLLLEQGYKPEEIFFFTVAGGIVQDGDDRTGGVKQVLEGVKGACPGLKKLIVTGHIGRCGAVAYWLKAQKGQMPAKLGEKDSEQEIGAMSGLIVSGANSLVPPELLGITEAWLVEPKINKETNEMKVETVKLDLATDKKLQVADFR